MGCDRGPEAYVVVLANGSPLPLLLAEQGGCAVRLMRGSLKLEAESKYVSELILKRECPDSAARTMNAGGMGRYKQYGDTVYFLGEQQTTSGKGLISGDTIIVRGPRHVLHYRKL